MRQISTEELIQKGVTRYSLIIGISKRAREIAEELNIVLIDQ